MSNSIYAIYADIRHTFEDTFSTTVVRYFLILITETFTIYKRIIHAVDPIGSCSAKLTTTDRCLRHSHCFCRTLRSLQSQPNKLKMTKTFVILYFHPYS